jgi:hypothetical protein
MYILRTRDLVCNKHAYIRISFFFEMPMFSMLSKTIDEAELSGNALRSPSVARNPANEPSLPTRHILTNEHNDR